MPRATGGADPDEDDVERRDARVRAIGAPGRRTRLPGKSWPRRPRDGAGAAGPAIAYGATAILSKNR